jgi:2,4-dienoyl-CoA reductase-like NADH-dependent reductase (Old Yellow Enzyme family)
MDLNVLSSAMKIGNRTASNRLVNQPMECNDADASGNPSDLTRNRYRHLAEGGAGMIMVESLSISPRSRARKNQLVIEKKNKAPLADMVREMKKINPESLIIFQINHSGIVSGSFSDVVSYYPAYTPTTDSTVRILTDDDIAEIQAQLVKAALITHEAGADGIDFKNCHGYLGGQLLRPANTKKGRFGGSFENRTRFFRETAGMMKSAIKDENFIFGARISIYEGILGGFGTAGPDEVAEDLSEPLALCRLIEDAGFDFINVSSGIPVMTGEITRPTQNYPMGVYRQFGWAEAVRDAVKMPLIGSAYSYLRNGENKLPGDVPEKKSLLYWATKNIQDGHVDMVGVGRQSLADPLFAKKVMTGEIDRIDFCKACNGCSVLLGSQARVGCAFYDKFYKEELREVRKKK